MIYFLHSRSKIQKIGSENVPILLRFKKKCLQGGDPPRKTPRRCILILPWVRLGLHNGGRVLRL